MPVPANYQPIIDPARKLMATPTPSMTPMYQIPEENLQLKKDIPAVPEGLPEMKPEDMQYFSKLLQVSAGTA
jgi:splicing factor 3B subunit 1